MQPYESATIPVALSGDVAMLGCVLAYIHQGKDPFNDDTIRSKAEPDIDLRIQTEQPRLYHHLLVSMMQPEPHDRPSVGHVPKHPYVLRVSLEDLKLLVV